MIAKFDEIVKIGGCTQLLRVHGNNYAPGCESAMVTRSRPKLNYGAGRDFGVGPEFGAMRKQLIIPGNSGARLCAGEEDRVIWLDLRPG